MGFDGTPGDAVGDVLEAGVLVEHFRGRGLPGQRGLERNRSETNLAVATALEEGGHANETDTVVPHDCVGGVVAGDLEVVVECWLGQFGPYSGASRGLLRTFETLSTSLGEEVFFPAVVGDSLARVLYRAEGADLESAHLAERRLI